MESKDTSLEDQTVKNNIRDKPERNSRHKSMSTNWQKSYGSRPLTSVNEDYERHKFNFESARIAVQGRNKLDRVDLPMQSKERLAHASIDGRSISFYVDSRQRSLSYHSHSG